MDGVIENRDYNTCKQRITRLIDHCLNWLHLKIYLGTEKGQMFCNNDQDFMSIFSVNLMQHGEHNVVSNIKQNILEKGK